MQNSLYKLFEHKCVLEVCVHIHPIMIKTHPMFFLLRGLYDAFLKIIILCIWCNRICWHALMLKKHIIFKILHYCRFSMPRLSQTFSIKSLLPTNANWHTAL